jgi:hypothetical protein
MMSPGNSRLESSTFSHSSSSLWLLLLVLDEDPARHSLGHIIHGHGGAVHLLFSLFSKEGRGSSNDLAVRMRQEQVVAADNSSMVEFKDIINNSNNNKKVVKQPGDNN